MAILRSTDGKFYDVGDDQLEDKLIPAEQIKEKLSEAGVAPAEGPMGGGPGPMSMGGGQVTIQIFTSPDAVGDPGPAPEGEEGDVEAHGYWRRNCWRNYWRRNCWRNYCY